MAAQLDERWSRLQDGLDGLYAHLGSIHTTQQLLAVQLDLASMAVHQVGHARGLLCASVVSEVATHEMLDNMPRVDNTEARAKKVPCKAPTVWGVTALETFDEMPLKEMATAHLERAVFRSPALSVAAACEVFDEKPLAEVVWDEDMSQDLSSHDGELQQLIWCDYLGGNESSLVVEQVTCNMLPVELGVNSSSPILGFGVVDAVKVFDGMPAQKVLEGDTCGSVVWDEMSACHDNHDGLLQQLACGGECVDDANSKLVMDEALASSDSLTPVTKLGLYARHHGPEETIYTFVDDSFLSLELGVIDTNQVVDEMHSMGEGTEMLEELVARSFSLHGAGEQIWQQHEKNWLKLQTCMAHEVKAGLFTPSLNHDLSVTSQVVNRMPPLRSTFSPEKDGMEADCVALDKMPSWVQGDFSPWSNITQLVSK